MNYLVLALVLCLPDHSLAREQQAKPRELDKYSEGCRFAIRSLREKGHDIRNVTEDIVCDLEMKSFEGKVNP